MKAELKNSQKYTVFIARKSNQQERDVRQKELTWYMKVNKSILGGKYVILVNKLSVLNIISW